MENATKALLIAAAVLVAIVLIALGVRLLGSAGDTSGQAKNVSNSIGDQIDNSQKQIDDSLQNLNFN